MIKDDYTLIKSTQLPLIFLPQLSPFHLQQPTPKIRRHSNNLEVMIFFFCVVTMSHSLRPPPWQAAQDLWHHLGRCHILDLWHYLGRCRRSRAACHGRDLNSCATATYYLFLLKFISKMAIYLIFLKKLFTTE